MIKEYITLFVVCIAIAVIIYLPIFFSLSKKGQGYIRPWSYLLFFLSLYLIVFATIILFQFPLSFNPERHILNLQPLQWLWEGGIKQRIVSEIRPNILIFMPLGFFTPIAFKRLRKWYMTALVAFSVTLSVEFFQYFIGRSSDIDDLIANVLGGLVGYGLFKIFCHVLKNKAWWNKFLGTHLASSDKFQITRRLKRRRHMEEK